MNVSKSSIPAISKFAVSGLEMNSADMTLTFPKEKKAKIVLQHQDLLGKIPASIKELSQLNSRLASTAAVEGNWELQFTNNHVHESVSRTKLVGAKPSLDKQKSNTFGILSRAQNWAILGVIRVQASCRYFGIQGSKIFRFTFTCMHPTVYSMHL